MPLLAKVNVLCQKGLLNRCTVKSCTGGSNPPLSARFLRFNQLTLISALKVRPPCRGRLGVLVSWRCPEALFHLAGSIFEVGVNHKKHRSLGHCSQSS